MFAQGLIQRIQKRHFLLFVFGVIFISALACSMYYYRQYHRLKAGTDAEAQKEVAALVSVIGAFMDLPADEIPTLATVLNKEQLKDQVFFQKAENGDKLLAYTKAMKAILYRPSTHKIIEVAPIYINQQPGTASAEAPLATSVPASIRIAYYNGTKVIGLSRQAEKAVQDATLGYQTAIITNAKSENYTATIVVDVSGKHAAEAKTIADLLRGTVGNLPSGEAAPDADILVISGQ